MKSKNMAIILGTIVILTVLTTTLFLAPFEAQAATFTYTPDNANIEGVLASDSYVLFPYLKKNLKIGFSKYGEMIDQVAKIGLLYDGNDTFAPAYGVPEKEWVEGWVLNITYDNGGSYANVWAFALHSDYYNESSIGGDWKEGVTGGSATINPLGGRKTSGGAFTDPIQVLYNGPRRFVALLKTTIYEAPDQDTPLVSLTFTIVFNKDKKQVIILKDVKRIDEGKGHGDMQIEFGDRGEFDLGRSASGQAPLSYARWFTNEGTVYDGDYQDWYEGAPGNYEGTYDVCQIVDDEYKWTAWAAYWPKPIGRWVGSTQHEISRGTGLLDTITTKTEVINWTDTYRANNNYTLANINVTKYPQRIAGAVYWQSVPMVFVNDIMQTQDEDFEYSETYHNVTFTTGNNPSAGSTIKFVYKIEVEKLEMGTPTQAHSPFVIGEWAFRMDTPLQQFRGVTIYGETDRNNGNSTTGSGYILDREISYYLNETFNPFDLYDAVHKQDSRWVEIDESTSSTASQFNLTRGLDDQIYYDYDYSWAGEGDHLFSWTGYYNQIDHTGGANSTWVNEFQNTGDVAHKKNWAMKLNGSLTGDEMLKVTPTVGTPTSAAPLTLQFKDLVDFGFWYKMVSGNQGPHVEIELFPYANATGDFIVISAHKHNLNVSTSVWQHYTLNAIRDFIDPPGQHPDNAFTNGTDGIWHSFEWWTSAYPNYYVGSVCAQIQAGNSSYVDDLSVAYLNKASGIRYERVYNMEEDKMVPSDFGEYCTFAERVLVNGTLIKRYGYHNSTAHESYYTIDFADGTITFYHYDSGYKLWTLGIGTHIKVLYSTIEENEKGRYEWIVVGKPAATVDSLATAYVTQAFDSIKAIHVSRAGMDYRDTTWGPNIPFVISGPGTGTRGAYVDSLDRPHLRDDWCTTWPVASSNMIFMAGPRANLGTEYLNEFTNAFYPRSEYVVNNTGHANTIMGLTCWNKYNYTSGYGVISVYKDLNGTIGLSFWGLEAQDFYYACQWFWNYPAGITCPDGAVVYSGIEYLQHENHGVTDIILHIDYEDPTHPTVSTNDFIHLGERLGTISEKGQHDP
ncbi:hypothetical protein MUP01_09235 [Candidatus Bathyarchaeota archaeon]|nr:hypothetical protein [Candidatus Bathyarchaeota archaeon]